MNAFLMSCFVLSVMNSKFEQCVCISIKFCMKLSKSNAETLEMLCETLEEHSSRFLNGIHILMLDKCQQKMINVQADQAPVK
jgi:hypothetical protein